MKPIIKPHDQMRKKRHHKQGDIPEYLIGQMEKNERKEKIERDKKIKRK